MSGVSGDATAWEELAPTTRKRIVWILWFVTWIGLLAGLWDPVYFEAVVAFSAAHAVLFLLLHRFRVAAFPVQVRIGYLLAVAVGTYVPYMTFLMYVALVGLLGNLFFRYCPLARMLCLLPWNREEPFSLGLVARVFLSPPVDGRFRPPPADGP